MKLSLGHVVQILGRWRDDATINAMTAARYFDDNNDCAITFVLVRQYDGDGAIRR